MAALNSPRNWIGRASGRDVTVYQVTDQLTHARTVCVPGDEIAAAVSAWLAELGTHSPLVEDLARAARAGDWPLAHALGEHLSVRVDLAVRDGNRTDESLNTKPGPRFIGGDPSAVTDSDVHALVGEFLNSGYRGQEYANWPIERRLDGFLRRRGLSRHAIDGDVCNVIIDHIMARVSGTGRAASSASPG